MSATIPCPLCGGTMREHVSACGTCPANGGCDMLCCDHCGYETVAPRSVTVELVKRVVRFVTRKKSAPGVSDSTH